MLPDYFISVDANGHNPVIAYKPLKEHYVKYLNEIPVEGKLVEGVQTVWNFKEQRMYGLVEGIDAYPFNGTRTLSVLPNFKEL